MDPVKAALVAYQTASKAYEAHREKLQGLKQEAWERIEGEQRTETNRLSSDRMAALRTWELARMERALTAEDGFAPGTHVTRTLKKYSSWGATFREEVQHGVVEVFSRETPNVMGRWRFEVGDKVVRLCKKDGKPGKRIDRLTTTGFYSWKAVEGGL